MSLRTIVVMFALALPVTASAQAPALLGVWYGSGFIHPTGLALDASYNLFVADLVNHQIQVLSSTGGFVRQWGSYGQDASSITMPSHLAVDAQGRVFVAEWGINSPAVQTGLQVFSASGEYLASWGAYGCSGLPGTFCGPFGVAVGPDGHVYVTDTAVSRIQTFSGDGTYLGEWSVKGSDVAADASGDLYVATGGGVWKFSASGAPLTSWGSAGVGPGQFNSPMAVAVDRNGLVYVADTYNHRVQVFTGAGAFLAMWGSYGSDPGQFYRPMGIAVGSDGRVFVADTYNNRIQVFAPVAAPTPALRPSWGSLKASYR